MNIVELWPLSQHGCVPFRDILELVQVLQSHEVGQFVTRVALELIEQTELFIL